MSQMLELLILDRETGLPIDAGLDFCAYGNAAKWYFMHEGLGWIQGESESDRLAIDTLLYLWTDSVEEFRKAVEYFRPREWIAKHADCVLATERKLRWVLLIK